MTNPDLITVDQLDSIEEFIDTLPDSLTAEERIDAIQRYCEIFWSYTAQRYCENIMDTSDRTPRS